jgi:hypothetical protein
MASAVSGDREAEVFAAPLEESAQPIKRRWHSLMTGVVAFGSLDEMKFGPRSYTPTQRLAIDRAVAIRTELTAPRLARG